MRRGAGVRWAGVLLALGVVGSGCSRGAQAPADCGERLEGMEALLLPGATVLLGELHGTQETPRLTGDLVCQAASRGVPVVLALELPQESDAAFAAYLASGGTPADRERLLQESEWQSPWPDGRTSQAMLGLLERVRTFRQRGWKVRVHGLGGGEYRNFPGDTDLAQNLLALRKAAPDALVLSLTGGNHARVDADLAMGGQLRRAGVPVVSLNLSVSGGSFWTCWGPECGVRTFGDEGPEAKPSLDLTPVVSKSAALWTEFTPGVPAHHGRVHLGKVSASPPANPAPMEAEAAR